ncbi:hypothetical protein [Novosphingobium sp.]|uniref:hypothetical protein n=1 Tax=Novosphingobium sp. TaxID=1874826 RepID=UPI003B516D22
MHKMMIAVLATAVAAIAVPGAASAAVCKDAKGKFIKCAPVAETHSTVTHAVMTRQTTVVTKPGLFSHPVMNAAYIKDKNGRCHYASGPKKGQFVKCA